jgi:hypothetical protein
MRRAEYSRASGYVRQPEDLVPAVPGRELEKNVGAYEEHQRAGRAMFRA